MSQAGGSRPWWRDPRAPPPIVSRYQSINPDASDGLPSPHLLNLYVMLVTLGWIVGMVVMGSWPPAILAGALMASMLHRLGKLERRWRRSHPGLRPRMTPLHWLVAGFLSLPLALVVIFELTR